MKIIDKYILKTFLITFTVVFVILFFIFILQTVWLLIAELAGKDLDISMVFKFLLFSMPRLVPLVLPLSILLASIMSFGDLSENYELAAMKSAGISLRRALQPLFLFVVFLSIAAFLFANSVIPYAEYKFINFRKNIAQAKPALAIAEGQFSDVGVYNIKVNKKSGENGENLTGITIHKKSELGDGSRIVIKAKKGKLVSSKDSNTLQLILNDGNYYEDILPKNYEDRPKMPFVKTSFKKNIINIDISEFNKIDVDNENITNTNTMLTTNELRYTIDSLQKNYKTDITSYTDNITQRVGFQKSTQPEVKIKKPKKKFNPNLLAYFNSNQQLDILNLATSNLESVKYSLETSNTEFKSKQININGHLIALYDKFVIAFACFLMFFIGAPLGAIIRKGGLGLPVVFAMLIFISFHFANTFGKKLAEEGGLTPFLGSWMSSLVLTPLAVLLTYRATNDIGLINLDIILAPIQQFIKKIVPQK
ncbi:LptF/LptG family permease [Flavobacterium sp.]|uniref:LptF/LptG family permease n=1 Tax=Flavobacterium sp. TaxID=239 RepID=UPI0008CC44CE|nr:LptF/LptG family permease [Flavobacterium sp.]OGS63758.1 MAG: permease [Flavobacteria bacterium GWA2_35_26]HCF04088.1 permease [Flavobacterium sp.]